MPDWLPILAYELLLYAACGFALFGVDDLLVDMLWYWKCRATAGEAPVIEYGRHKDGKEPPIAIFIAAWRESAVIDAMLDRCLKVWAHDRLKIFVGCYPNDPETLAIVRHREGDRLKAVAVGHDGPTTKADCLNAVWQAMLADEAKEGRLFSAIVLHDAEDHVHYAEISLFNRFLGSASLIQIPVLPEPDPRSRWIAGHYLDEFAEAHQKDMIVRQWIGASLPSAGTGCAIARSAIAEIAEERRSEPFDADSLTEDYELGLRLGGRAHSSLFVRAFTQDGDLIAVRSCFPSTIRASVRQKSRWVIGIALAGWDRMGWSGGIAEHWMRWRDRRSLLTATYLVAAYLGMILALLVWFKGKDLPESSWFGGLLLVNFLLLLCRLIARAHFSGLQYGWLEGAIAIPRSFVSNVIAIMAAWRALLGYLKIIATGKVTWDKTEHRMPGPRHD